MEITESREGRTVVLALSGRVDTASAPLLVSQANVACDTGIGGIVLDMAQMAYMTSAGFRALIAIKRRTDRGNIAFVLCGINDMVQDLFEISGLRNSFRIHPDRVAALAAVAGPVPG